MRGTVDAPGKSGDDREPLLSQVMRQAASEAAGCGGRVARPDDRDGLSVEQIEIALRDHERRRVLELCQQARIETLPQHQIFRAELLNSRDLALSLVTAEEPRRCTAAP